MQWRLFRLNWSYGIGELFIVVVGVLIALAVNQWNDNRLARGQEVAIVERLLSDLRADIEGLEFQFMALGRKEASLVRLQQHFADRETVPADPVAFAQDIIEGANYGWNQYQARRTTFEELLASGRFSLIRASNVRDRIGAYYALEAGAHQRIDERETQFPHISYRLILRRNEGQSDADIGLIDVEPDFAHLSIDQLMREVYDSELGQHVIAEINLARFIRNIGDSIRTQCLGLIEYLEVYLSEIR